MAPRSAGDRETAVDLGGLIDRYCGAWSTPDGIYSDPLGEAAGMPALLARIAAAQDRWPGIRIDQPP